MRGRGEGVGQKSEGGRQREQGVGGRMRGKVKGVVEDVRCLQMLKERASREDSSLPVALYSDFDTATQQTMHSTAHALNNITRDSRYAANVFRTAALVRLDRANNNQLVLPLTEGEVVLVSNLCSCTLYGPLEGKDGRTTHALRGLTTSCVARK